MIMLDVAIFVVFFVFGFVVARLIHEGITNR